MAANSLNNNDIKAEDLISNAIEEDQINVEMDEIKQATTVSNNLKIYELLPHHCAQFFCLS